MMNNLLKMERYHLLHNWVYWAGMLGIFLIGFYTAETYETYVPEMMGLTGKPATSLTDIFNSMVYDSTFILILTATILALIFSQEFSWRTIIQEVSAGHKRTEVFISKIISYLIAFNAMAIIFPIAGCVRELSRFGLADGGLLLYSIIKGIIYSLLLNSTVFLLAILLCCLLRSTAKAVPTVALLFFALSMYFAFGMMEKLPVKFLPFFQIRKVVSNSGFVFPTAILTVVVWAVLLLIISWRIFKKCDLK